MSHRTNASTSNPKTLASAFDMSAFSTSVLAQPAFYTGVGSLGLAIYTQLAPQEVMPIPTEGGGGNTAGGATGNQLHKNNSGNLFTLNSSNTQQQQRQQQTVLQRLVAVWGRVKDRFVRDPQKQQQRGLGELAATRPGVVAGGAAAGTNASSSTRHGSPTPPNPTPVYATRLRPHRGLLIPFTSISLGYIAIADRVANNHPMGGHFSGALLSSCLAVGGFSLIRISLFWPLVGVAYGTFGVAHHMRALNMIYDGIPIVTLGDVEEVVADACYYRRRAEVRKLGGG